VSQAIAFDVERCDHFIESGGTIVLTIRVDPCDAQSFLANSPDAGGRLFVAPAPELLKPPDPLSLSADYSDAACQLIDSKFFEFSEIWPKIGTNNQYLEWIRKQKCWLAKKPGHVCAGDIVAAHVRRIRNGAGTALKPKYSAIPLCAQAHDDQHQNGESAIGGRDRVDVALSRYLRRWSVITVLDLLGYQNLSNVPPVKLRGWAQAANLITRLPPVYKQATQ